MERANVFTGFWKRYRILAIDRLLESLDMACLDDFRAVYEAGIEEKLRQRRLYREPEWTESLAVGNRVFVERVAQSCKRRSKFTYAEAIGGEHQDTWAVREQSEPYTAFLGSKSGCKPSHSPKNIRKTFPVKEL